MGRAVRVPQRYAHWTRLDTIAHHVDHSVLRGGYLYQKDRWVHTGAELEAYPVASGFALLAL